MSNIAIPDGVTEISANALKNNTSIENITVSNDVTSIGASAFENCTNLSELNLGTDSNAAASATSLLASIGNNAFKNCSKLEYITIPTSVKTIGTSAFNGCEKLKDIIIDTEYGYYLADNESDTSGEDFPTFNSQKVAEELINSSDKYLKYSKLYIPHYPQTYVGNSLNNILKSMLADHKLIATGKTYTTDVNATTKVLPEYEHEGERYVYLDSAKVYGATYINGVWTGGIKEGILFFDGTEIHQNDAYFFKVEVIEFETFNLNNETVYITKNVLGSRRFDNNSNAWTDDGNCEIREYLNGTFAQDSGIGSIATIHANVNNVTNEYTSNNGATTYDKVWLLSVEEVLNWSGTGTANVSLLNNESRKYISDSNDILRRCEHTDFARATFINAWYYPESEGSPYKYYAYYSLRSAGVSDHHVCYVQWSGLVYSDYSGNESVVSGFRPAFVLDN